MPIYSSSNQSVTADCQRIFAVDTMPLNCRYDHQIAIWGKRFQERLGQIRMFLVGAGALGCEFLKSFALMGCCTNERK